MLETIEEKINNPLTSYLNGFQIELVLINIC